MLNRGEVLGCFLGLDLSEQAVPVLGAGLVSSSSKHPLPRARQQTSAPHHGSCHPAAPAAVPAGGRVRVPFVSNLLSLPTPRFEL